MHFIIKSLIDLRTQNKKKTMSQEQMRVITLLNESEKLPCEVCKEDIYHTITMQAIKQSRVWKLRLIAICIRCRTKDESNFSQD